MNTRNDSLWDRIETHPIGPQSSVLGFERRLARDNGWSEAYASRVIHEYRRFLFLAARAGHPVTPSDAVDQAWHLHLIYTEDYWTGWCQEVLGFPFHHGPTRGGRPEQTKYADWYARTLASYQQWFGTPPPSDIWPSAEDRFAGAAAFRRVNTAQVWIVPKPSTRTLVQWSAAAMAAVGLTGCGALAVTDWNIFDWTGTPFLILYLCLMAAALAVLLMTRWQRGNSDTSADTRLEAEDPYVVAGLVDGARGILQAGLAALAARGLIESHPATPGWIGRRKGAQPGNLSQNEEAIWEAIPSDREIETRKLRKELKPLFASVRRQVQQRGWEPRPAALASARLWRAGMVLSLVALGVVKMAIGHYRDRPIGFLVVLTLATLFFGLILALQLPRRTRAGQAKFKELHAQEAELRHSLRQSNLDPSWSVPMMVAIFGGTALAGTALASWQTVLPRPLPRPASNTADSSGGCSGAWSDTSSTSSSSGSSDGGGDGGGDGGSGCGGCGGCGGGGD